MFVALEDEWSDKKLGTGILDAVDSNRLTLESLIELLPVLFTIRLLSFIVIIIIEWLLYHEIIQQKLGTYCTKNPKNGVTVLIKE